MIRFKMLPILLLALTGSSTRIAAAEAAKLIAITHVRIFDGSKVIPDGTVVVEGRTIRAVGAKAAVPAGAEVIDGTGRHAAARPHRRPHPHLGRGARPRRRLRRHHRARHVHRSRASPAPCAKSRRRPALPAGPTC